MGMDHESRLCGLGLVEVDVRGWGLATMLFFNWCNVCSLRVML